MFSRLQVALYRLNRYHHPLSAEAELRPRGESQGQLASSSRPVPSGPQPHCDRDPHGSQKQV